MAWGDPGGPSSGDMGSGNFGGMDGHGSFGDSLGTRGPGGGYGSGHSNTAGGGGGATPGGGTNLGDEIATEGPGDGYGAGHNSTDGGYGDGAPSSSSQTASRADLATQTRAEARRSGVYGQVDAQAMGAVTEGAIASFDDSRGFMGEVQAQSRPGLAVDMGPGLSQSDLSTVANDIQANASPGVIGRGLSMLAGTANPAAGLAVDTAARAYDASSQIGQLNADFDAGLDGSFGGNLGQQAIGAVGGLAGQRAGGLIGSRLGSGFGVPGQIAGAVGGSVVGKSFGRDVAMNGLDGQGSTPGAGIAGGGGNAPSGATMTAGTTQPQAGTPAAQTPDSSGYGPASLTGYASYAQSFFA